MFYEGIKLIPPQGPVVMSHSDALDMIKGKSSTQNMDWMDAMYSVPWGIVKSSHPDRFDQASYICSLSNMTYQVCNGGITQYFDNGYHKERDPFSENDVVRVDLGDQKYFFEEIVEFAKVVYPERVAKNAALETACKAFGQLWFEEDAIHYDTVYCDEDEFIWDDELEEDVKNPDYFEPYEDPYYEDEIHGDAGFNDTFYKANDYLEELLELHSQLCCRQLVLEAEKENDHQLISQLLDVLPASAFAGSIIQYVKEQIANLECTTAYGEPQAWVSLNNGRSIEVTLEQEMLAESQQFFSARLHCSEAEYEAGAFEDTLGVIQTFTSEGKSLDELDSLVESVLSWYDAHPIENKEIVQEASAVKLSLDEQIRAADAKSASASAPQVKEQGREASSADDHDLNRT